MSSKNYYFIYNGEHFPANLQLESLPDHIQQDFEASSNYEIKTSVKKENLTMFINYFLNKSATPVFNCENISDFYFLSKEFHINTLTEEIDTKYSDLLRISILTSATSASNNDILDSEEFIAEHLDAFLTLNKSDMYKIRLTSLYNIFFSSKRRLNNEKLAYQFITESPTNDSKLSVLLGSLENKNLNEESMRDSITKKEDHLGFSSRIDFGFIENLSQKVASMESEMAKMRDEQMKLIEENKKVTSVESEMEKMKKKMEDEEAIILGLIEQAPDVGSICVSGISNN